MDPRPTPRTAEGYAAQYLGHRIADAAGVFERLAATLRGNLADDGTVRPGATTMYTTIAATIQREAASAFALAALSELTRHAGEADVARAKGE